MSEDQSGFAPSTYLKLLNRRPLPSDFNGHKPSLAHGTSVTENESTSTSNLTSNEDEDDVRYILKQKKTKKN